MKWDDYYMSLVYLTAMKSKDEQTHLGAVIVGPDKEIRSTGYNSFPRGIDDNISARQERPEKYFWFEHAERNAIYNATLIGSSLKNCIMYTNGIPCMDCARAVIQSGIKEIVVDKTWDDNNCEKWNEHTNRSIVMFNEAGIKVRRIDFEFPEILSLRKGQKTVLATKVIDIAETD